MSSNLAKTLYSLALALENKRNTSKTLTVRSVAKLGLEICGFVLLTVAGFEINSLAGFITAGFCCFAFAWHIGSDDESTNTNDPLIRNRR